MSNMLEARTKGTLENKQGSKMAKVQQNDHSVQFYHMYKAPWENENRPLLKTM